ncbi:hypothetical protein CDHC03_0108 [Corynebacterium diphtheriae HC03]|nr:hypothetical protein CDHC03_0108 [Corynebacterium diphtheriae HC03]
MTSLTHTVLGCSGVTLQFKRFFVMWLVWPWYELYLLRGLTLDFKPT